MINCITGKIEQVCGRLRNIGKKVFDIPELEAKVYHQKVADTDIFTALDKDYNKLLVQKVGLNKAQEKEVVSRFSVLKGHDLTIKSTLKTGN